MKLQKQIRPDETFQIEFIGQTIDAYRMKDTIYVGVRSICRNLDITYSVQERKLKQNSIFQDSIVKMVTVTKNGNRLSTMLSLKKLNLWLSTININRLKNTNNERLLAYQRECADVLFRHFSGQPTEKEVSEKDEKIIDLIGQVVKLVSNLSDRMDRMEQKQIQPPKKKRRSQNKYQQELFDTPRKKLVKKMRSVARTEDPREAWLKLYAKTKQKIGVDLISLSKGSYRPLDVAEDFEIIPNMIMIADLLWRE